LENFIQKAEIISLASGISKSDFTCHNGIMAGPSPNSQN
jgi:hypothetical protein